jgi:hypothetical protein
MALTSRDVSVIRFLSLFGQATSTQIRAVIFGGVHPSAFDTSLKRLLPTGYIARIGRYGTSDVGGSPPIVYALGGRGRELVRGSPVIKRILAHRLDICQAYVDFVTAERQGDLKVLRYATEVPVVEGTRADIAIEVGIVKDGKPLKLSYYIEIDEDTMGKARIAKKLRGYSEAGHNAHVVFGVIDEPRAKTINRYVREHGYDEDVFHACQFKEVVPLCLSLFEVAGSGPRD